MADLDREVFGPVLHVIRYRRRDLDRLIEAINATGYGLTFGLHTRLDGTIAHVTQRIQAGNVYVNRNVIGAVVGVQPFGGRGLSGTGPKAGGLLYLGRLVARAPAMQHDAAANPTLADYIAWLDANALATEANIARDLGRRSALGFATELKGPVGERNLYALHPRGRLLLTPRSAAGLYHQLGAMLATGNTAVIADARDLEPLLRSLPAHIATRIAWRTDWESDGPFAGALIEGDAERVADINARIARLRGPLVPVQAASSQDLAAGPDAYCLDRLLEEVSTSINTTAAGGNASLMALS